MGQALYRKYRPTSFEEAVGQESTTKTLSEAIRSGRISHAYLFAGPRGVGKTSLARIMAHAVNNLPYKDDAVHLDIIEIDAASNRRIDEIRDLREKVHVMPSAAKYKVYIIDEVHMLTKEAFNALLKTLEEPPSHIIFILATTEPHKLPETIISRTQRYNFKPISKNDAKNQLQKIARAEKIKISDEALDLLVEYGEGSLRDNIGLLDQLSSHRRGISEADARELLGIPSRQVVADLIKSILGGDSPAALATIDKLNDQATSPLSVAKALAHQLRQQLLAGKISGHWLNVLFKDLLGVSASASPRQALELAVLSATTSTPGNQHSISAAVPANAAGPNKNAPKTTTTRAASIEPVKKIAAFKLGQWSELLNKVREEAPTLYTALKLAKPSLKDGQLNLEFPYNLHKKKVNEANNIQIIGRVVERLSGDKVIIKCSVDRNLSTERSPKPAGKPLDSFQLKTISNIFGSAEVVES